MVHRVLYHWPRLWNRTTAHIQCSSNGRSVHLQLPHCGSQVILPLKKNIPIDRTLRHLYFFLVCLKIFRNYQFYEEQKTRKGAGILINFSADTMFNLRLYFHFKTPQKRYCKSPAGPQHKARLLIKSWNGSCQVCLQGCATLAVHTTCLLRPRLNY